MIIEHAAYYRSTERSIGIDIGREKVRLIGRREGLQVPDKSPKRRRCGSSREVSKARFRAMCGVMISSLSGRKMARR